MPISSGQIHFKKVNTTEVGKEDLEKLKSELKLELKKESTRFIEILAILVAVFSFISIDIQIFKFTNSLWSAVGLSFILFGLLAFFVSFLIAFLDRSRFAYIVLFISIIFVLFGTIFIIKENKKITAIESEKLLKGEFDDFKICIKTKGLFSCL